MVSTASVTSAGKVTLTDTRTGTSAPCQSSSMSGTLKSGSGLPGAGIGAIAAASFFCSSVIGPIRITPHGLPWQLNLSSFDIGTGVSRGTVSHVRLTFSLSGVSPACSAVINGTSGTAADGIVAITYSDQGAKLKVLRAGGNLHWYHVQHCVGLIDNGDPAALSGVYSISPAQTITSP